MKVSANMTYLGYEKGTNKDGKEYTVLGLLQGFDSEKMYINNDDIKKKIETLKPMSQVTCTINISMYGEKTYMNLVDIEPVKAS